MMMPCLYQRLHHQHFYHRRPREFRRRIIHSIPRSFLDEWSAGSIASFSDDFYSIAAEDLDALDMEEREKLVKHMWDVYTNGKKVGLPSFWKDAFVAAYEDLTCEVPEVREAAITELARMSIHHIKILPTPLHSSSSLGQPRSEAKARIRQGNELKTE